MDTVCLHRGGGEVSRRHNIAPSPSHTPNLIKNVSATFILGTDLTTEFTPL